MFKRLLSDNRLFYGLVCLLVFIAGGVIYLQVVKSHARRDVQRTQKSVKQRYTPQTGEAEPQSAEGGHYHSDGTYHVGSHESETPSATPPTTPQPTQSREAVNVAQVRPPVPDVAAATPSQQPSPQTPASTPTSETDRLQVLRDIRKTLPSHATVADIVAASDFVPSKDEVAVMTDEVLIVLAENGMEKAKAIEGEMQESMDAWFKIIDELTSDENTFAENQRILAEHSDRVKPLRDKMDATRYEYYIHEVTARRALGEVSQRTNKSIAEYMPLLHEILKDHPRQQESEDADLEERP